MRPVVFRPMEELSLDVHTPSTLYKGKKVVPKDLPSLKIHASSLRNSLAAEEAAGGPRARARSVVHITRHEATLSHGTALGARQPCPSMIHVRARACSDDGCLRMTARTCRRRSTQNEPWQSRARAEHGLSCCAQPMHDRHDAEPLNLPARAQESQVGLRGRHAAERRRREVDIGLLRSGGPIEGLGLASTMRGSSPAIRLMHVCSFANRVRVTVYRVGIKVMTPKLVEHFKLHHLLYMPPGLQAS